MSQRQPEFIASGHGSLGIMDPSLTFLHRMSEEERSRLSSSAEMWMTSNAGMYGCVRNKAKSRCDAAFGQVSPTGRLTEREFDEWLLRAGEPCPTFSDVARWEYLMRKMFGQIGKTKSEDYLYTICRWKFDGNDTDASLMASLEEYMRCKVLPESGRVAPGTVALARKLGCSIDDFVAARNAAAKHLLGTHSAEDWARARKQLKLSVSMDPMQVVAALALSASPCPPNNDQEVGEWLGDIWCTGMCFEGCECIDGLHATGDAIAQIIPSDTGPERQNFVVSSGSFNDYKTNRHACFCQALLVSNREYMITTSEAAGHAVTGPFIVFDIRFVFESAKGARQFLRRGITFLAEKNDAPDSLADQVLMEIDNEVHDVPKWGDESRVFSGPGTRMQEHLWKDYAPGKTSWNVLIRVGNVVAKLFTMMPAGMLPNHHVYPWASHTSDRLQSWLAAYGNLCHTLLERLPGPALCCFEARHDAACTLSRRVVEAAAKPDIRLFAKTSLQACSSCGKQTDDCKRCGGCWRYYFCGSKCQRDFWDNGHNETCCREFELKSVRRTA